MFNKLHLQLTIFFSLVTGGILAALSIACLLISETAIRQNSEVIFQNQLTAVISYLENQNQISYQWLATTQDNGHLVLAIEDGGIPLKYSSLTQTAETAKAIETARQTAANTYHFDIADPDSTIKNTRHIEFDLPRSSANLSQSFRAAAISIPKAHSRLGVLLLYSLESLNDQLTGQRLLFLLLDLAAFALLTLFSWRHTRKLLKPIETSRERQVQFVAAASHELRTPIMVIQSSLSAMTDANPEEARLFADNIRTESDRMAHLVADMLTLARADSSSWSLSMAATELDTLLIDVYERYETLAAEKNIRLLFSLPDTLLPKCRCDGMRIEQVLIILIDNALYFTPSGGQITLSVREQGRRLEIRVADNGPGIADSEKDQVFERFYSRKHDQNRESFGLGLSIAREIIHLHKGRISVEDTPGGGATFVILLPISPS